MDHGEAPTVEALPEKLTAMDMLRRAQRLAGYDPDEIAARAADPDVIPPDELETVNIDADPGPIDRPMHQDPLPLTDAETLLAEKEQQPY